MTDADPTPDAPSDEEHGRPRITDRTVSEVVERTRDVIRKTREMLESSRDLLDRVRHRDGEARADDDAPGEHDADESADGGAAADARPVDGRA